MSSTLTSQIASLTLTHPDASSSDILFSPDLISKPVIASLPAGFILRPLSKTDFEKGYLDVLAQLTTVGEISKALFEERFEWMKRRNEEYFVVVLEDLKDGKIAGTGTVLVENKFIHKCGKVGHIEDIVVSSAYRGKNFGRTIIDALNHVSQAVGCYKTILCCLDKNVPFYEKCGLTPKEVCMAIYYPKNDK